MADHFAAQLAAYELVLDAATRHTPVSEAWLRGLHAQVTAAQSAYPVHTPVGRQNHPLPHGEYKDQPNHVRGRDGRLHAYAPVAATGPEMHHLVEQLHGTAFTAVHPVVQAAFAHYTLVAVHPFADGNGRTARAVASVYTYRSTGCPLVIFADQRPGYRRALADADAGRLQAFVDFVFDRIVDTLAMVADDLRVTRRAAQPARARLEGLMRLHGGLTLDEIDAVGRRIAERLRAAVDEGVAGAGLPNEVRVTVTGLAGPSLCNFAGRPYQSLRGGGTFHVDLAADQPAPLTVQATPVVGVAKELTNRSTFVVIDSRRPTTPPLRLRIQDVHPQLTAAAEALITGWAGRLVDTLVDDLEAEMRQALRDAGLQP